MNNLVVHYNFAKYNYLNLHSAGPEVYFDSPCIGYVKKGFAKFLYNGQTYYAYAGDLVYIASKTLYHSIWYGSPEIELYSINFKFVSEFAFYDYRFQILKDYPSELFDKMYESYNHSQMLSISYFYQVLDDIYKKLTPSPVDSSYKVIENAIKHIENNYNSEIMIKDLTDMCHLSQSGFFKLFKKATGVTPVAYKHNIMIQHALDLLSHTSLSIEEISSKVGFSSSNYFRTVFFKLTGKTPKELR